MPAQARWSRFTTSCAPKRRAWSVCSTTIDGRETTFRVLLCSPEKTFDDYVHLRLDEQAELAAGRYAIREAGPECVRLTCATSRAGTGPMVDSLEPLRCAKQFSFAHDGEGFRISCAVELQSDGAALQVQLGLEVILNFLAPQEPNRYFDTAAGRMSLRWAAAVPVADLNPARLRIVDEWQNVAATIEAPAAHQLWIAPIEHGLQNRRRRLRAGLPGVANPGRLARGAGRRCDVAR